MGSCKSKTKVNGDDHILVEDDIDDEHLVKEMYKKNGKPLHDVVSMKESAHNLSEEDEYYHSDDGDSDDQDDVDDEITAVFAENGAGDDGMSKSWHGSRSAR